MAVTWLTPADLGVSTTGSWVDVDVSGSVAEGATGVILHVVNEGGSEYASGLRKNGSTDNRTHILRDGGHWWAAIGIDGSGIFEAYIGNADVDIYLAGYTNEEAVFFDNGIEKTGSANSWVDVDISANTGEDTAIGVILEICNDDASNQNWSVRKNGSTDTLKGLLQDGAHAWAFIGVDELEIFELWVDDTDVKAYVIGYFTKDVTFNTNCIDYSLGITDTYTDLTALPEGATGGFFLIESGNYSVNYALRKKGTDEDIYKLVTRFFFGAVECDESRIIEGKIDTGNANFFLIGYTTGEGEEPPEASAENAVFFGMNF